MWSYFEGSVKTNASFSFFNVDAKISHLPARLRMAKLHSIKKYINKKDRINKLTCTLTERVYTNVFSKMAQKQPLNLCLFTSGKMAFQI